mgnify:CR=1 FL=1
MEYVSRYSENITLDQECFNDTNGVESVNGIVDSKGISTFLSNKEIDEDRIIDEYIVGVASKDKESFRNLYEMTKTKVYAYALAMIKNSDDALDVLHDVFIKVYDNAHSYTSKGKPLAWIFTITRNEVLMKLRKQKQMLDIDELSECLESNKKITVEDKMILEMIFKEISDLERKILLLHVVTGYKFHEIARSLEMPTATVITKYNRLIKRIKNGISISIIGEPNAGKSSLLNALLEEEKAIVTNVAGTTRDIVEGKIILNGIVCNIIDTAGIRETDNLVEQIGVTKSYNIIDSSDLIIMILNNNEEITDEELELLSKIKNKNHIIVVNKTDLPNKLNLYVEDSIKISIKDNTGIDEIKNKIIEIFNLDKIATTDLSYLSNARSISLLKKSLDRIKEISEEYGLSYHSQNIRTIE